MTGLLCPSRRVAALLLIAATFACPAPKARAAPDAATPAPFHVKGTVVGPDGKPAAGVSVLYERFPLPTLASQTMTGANDADRDDGHQRRV